MENINSNFKEERNFKKILFNLKELLNDKKSLEKIYNIFCTIVIAISSIVGFYLLPHITSDEIKIVEDAIIYTNNNYDGKSIIELSDKNIIIENITITEIKASYYGKTEIVTGYLENEEMKFKINDNISVRFGMGFGFCLGTTLIYAIIGLKIFKR